MTKLFEKFSAKNLLLDTLSDKLKGTGIEKITIIFCLDISRYNILMSTHDGKNMKVDITADEITTLRKIFIRRIVAKWKESYDDEPKSVIVQVDLSTKELDIFIENMSGKVLKFDYTL